MRKNDIITAVIDGYTSEGLGVCHVQSRAVFVPGTVKGEKWDVRIVKVTAGAIYGKGERLIEASPDRTEPDCPYFGRCGGCDTRHMSYAEELRFKLDRVNDALTRLGGQTVIAEEIIGSDEQIRYRNKGIFEIGSLEGKPACGFYRERSHQLIPVDRCLIQNELTERCAHAVTRFMDERNIPPYDEQTGKGTVRHVFCRRAVQTRDAVVCIISARGFGANTPILVEELRAACPELTGIVLNINKTKGNAVLSGDFYTLWGQSEIRDVLCGNEFLISPRAFFQINPPQAERLYERAAEYAALTKDETALDMYCGAGTISLRLARDAGHVIGAEIVPEAIENARENARRSKADNTEFICADAGEAARKLKSRGVHPDAVVVDPPRKGMYEDAVNAIASMEPKRIVYVSCEPSTLARDVQRFSALGYELKKVTAVDMFPRTCHVETVVLMSRA